MGKCVVFGKETRKVLFKVALVKIYICSGVRVSELIEAGFDCATELESKKFLGTRK